MRVPEGTHVILKAIGIPAIALTRRDWDFVSDSSSRLRRGRGDSWRADTTVGVPIHSGGRWAVGRVAHYCKQVLAIVSDVRQGGGMASLNVGNLGDYLREQRRNAQLSLRQLADAAGVSNPYLSQIERGLRKPSAEVLQQVAKALRISAETLYVRAGILDAERDRDDLETRAVILADLTLTERQKQVLLQIYESFRKENGFVGPEGGETTGSAGGVDAADVLGSVDAVGVVGSAGAAQGAEVVDVAEASDATDGSGGGAGIRRRGRQGGGGASAGRRAPSSSKGGPSAERRPREAGGTDTDPQQTAG